ncbi:hypothetical protein CBL_04727 [Carabus blaptoides fortunei]
MFSKTTFVFALMALFAVQSSSALQPQEVDERSLSDLIEQAKEAIKNLSEIVNSTIKNAIDKLSTIKDEILANAQDIIADAKNNITSIIDKVKVEIDKIKEQAANLGDDVKECIDKNSAEIEQLPQKIIDKLLQCIYEPVDEALSIIEQAINKILAIKDELTGLPQKLKGCFVTVNPVSCVTTLIAQIVKDTVSVPTDIQNIVSQILELVANLEIKMKACAVEKAIEASMEAAAIGVKVAKCVTEQNEA